MATQVETAAPGSGEEEEEDWERLLTSSSDGEEALPRALATLTLTGSRTAPPTAAATPRQADSHRPPEALGEGIHTTTLLAQVPAHFGGLGLVAALSDVLPAPPSPATTTSPNPPEPVRPGFRIRWQDPTHALLTFPSPDLAKRAYLGMVGHPLVQLTPHAAVAEEEGEGLDPRIAPTRRPPTTDAVARRMIAGALGLRAPPKDREGREADRAKIAAAQAARRQAREQAEAKQSQLDSMWNA